MAAAAAASPRAPFRYVCLADAKEIHYLRIYLAQLCRKLEDDPSRPNHLLTKAWHGLSHSGSSDPGAPNVDLRAKVARISTTSRRGTEVGCVLVTSP